VKHLDLLEKQKQANPKADRQKEIAMLRVENNKMSQASVALAYNPYLFRRQRSGGLRFEASPGK
jgi:hypothetical protein